MSRLEKLIADVSAGRISRRDFIAQTMALGATSATLGLGLSTKANAADITVGFSFPSFEHFRWAHDRAYFQARADELGMKYIVQGAEEDVSKQDAQVDAMLAQGIQALIIIPVNIDAGKDLIERVKADANIPVISYNYVIPSPKLDYWCARDNYLVGEIQAKQALAQAKKGNWAIVSGPSGVDVARQKTEGALRVLKPFIDSGEIKIVSHEWHDAWRAEGALAQIENALTKTNNDLQAVVANEDGMALGALRALTEQGLAGKVWLCGEDVFPEVGREIVKGNIAMSAWTDLIQMGRAAADAAFALAQGKKPESNDKVTVEGVDVAGMRIQSRGVDRANLAEFLKLTDWLKPEDVGL
ncbi:substrate-binding domain-containing protein [Mesorhizobium sp. ISC25]|uniref:sugar ABC transporter substrate-binding protein n=1 Tax=Mesorhizobium sp. ISC25 TaxID=3077335 RepID=UPI0035E10DF7